MNELIVIALVGIYFIAGAIKGTLGIGFPTAAIALTATFFDARTAIAYVIIPMCLINAWQIYRSGHLKRTLVNNWRLVVSMVITITAFSLMSADVPIRWLTLLLGIITSMFAIISLWRSPPRLPDRFDKMAQFSTGAISGVIGGLAGIWAPPIIVYLTSRRVSRAVFVQTTGVLLFIGSFVLLVGYTYTGIVNSQNAFKSFLLLIPAIAGFTVGEKLSTKLSKERFEKLILLFFLLLGLNFIRRAVFMH